MDVLWGQALQIGGVGFVTVFALLVLLAIVIWLTGIVLGKIDASKIETSDKKKGE